LLGLLYFEYDLSYAIVLIFTNHRYLLTGGFSLLFLFGDFMQLSRYLKTFHGPDQPGNHLLYSTRTLASVLVNDATLLAARESSLTEEEETTLARLGILVKDRDEEQSVMRDILVNINTQRTVFSGIVVLNLDCNLACSYCYEDNFRGRHYMSSTTADLLVETIQHNQIEQGRNVTLTFYGGEPLLSIPLIKTISSKLQQAAEKQGTKFRFTLVTNGTLFSHGVAEDLLPLGLFGAKFTLDGPRHIHDQCRPFVSGKGSFDIIVNNIKEVCDLIALQLGGNFTRHNYHDFPLLLDHLLAEGITPDKLTPVLFTPVIPKAGNRVDADFGNSCVRDYEPWLTEASLYLREETLRRGYAAPKPKLSVCMVELENDMVVNYDGSLFKCPAFMAHDELRIGTLADGVNDYRVSHNMDIWKRNECLNCAYLPLCFGGCRQMTLSRNGKINEVDCRKGFYDAALEQIIRQDLKYQTTKRV
jgi:uncharacterized protein